MKKIVKCKLCNRQLISKISKSIGYGKICAKRAKIYYPTEEEYRNSRTIKEIANESYKILKRSTYNYPYCNLQLTLKNAKILINLAQTKLSQLNYNILYKELDGADGQQCEIGKIIFIHPRIVSDKRRFAYVLIHELAHATGDKEWLDRNCHRYYNGHLAKLNEEMIADFTFYVIMHKFRMLNDVDLYKFARYCKQIAKGVHLKLCDFQTIDTLTQYVEDILNFLKI